MRSVLKRFRLDETGTSLIEFTLATPLLMVLGFGVFEFGHVLYGHHVITTGVHDAARFLARFPDPSAKYATAKTLAVTGSTTGTVQRLYWWSTSAVSISTSSIANPINAGTGASTYRGPDPLTVVRVSTTASYPGLGFLGYLGLGSALTFTVFHEERVIHE
jgi:Flp pilus assembly protein TadG